MDYSQFTEDEQRLLKISDEDNKKILRAYVPGEKYTSELIKSLALQESKELCYDYNRHIDEIKYSQAQIDSFSNYIETMKSWYK